MTPFPSPPGLTLRPPQPEDDARIMAIFNAIHSDTPPMSVEEYRQWMRNRPANARMARYVAELDGEIVGTFDLSEAIWVKRPGTWFTYLEVDEPYRKRGIGSMLYNRMIDSAQGFKAQRIYATVREHVTESVSFAQHRGFHRTGRSERLSRLNVADSNLEGFEDAEAQLTQNGMRIVSLAEIGVHDETFLRRLHAMESSTLQDIPSSEELDIEPYELWAARVVKGVGRSPDSFWIALHGDKPVGVARLTRRGDRSAFNGYTAVDREYRGRGIARALKRRTVEWARHNGIESIYTGNDLENHRMLSINVSLGYEALPPEIEMLKELDDEHPASI